MADQPTKAMTLREAVEHIQMCPNGYGQDGCGVCCDRARAIVDAAVLFVEAEAEVDAAQNAEPFDGQRMSLAWNNSCDTWRKLRALERGENPKP